MRYSTSVQSVPVHTIVKKPMLDPKKKQRIINKFKTHEHDTGSSEVQIAILTEEIKELTKHLQQHKHDFSSRRGLLKKLGERKRLLRYLKADNQPSYEKLIKELKLRESRKFEEKEEEIKKILAAEEQAELDKENPEMEGTEEKATDEEE
jgi:small subunit ribosomal protein S15